MKLISLTRLRKEGKITVWVEPCHQRLFTAVFLITIVWIHIDLLFFLSCTFSVFNFGIYEGIIYMLSIIKCLLNCKNTIYSHYSLHCMQIVSLPNKSTRSIFWRKWGWCKYFEINYTPPGLQMQASLFPGVLCHYNLYYCLLCGSGITTK